MTNEKTPARSLAAVLNAIIKKAKQEKRFGHASETSPDPMWMLGGLTPIGWKTVCVYLAADGVNISEAFRIGTEQAEAVWQRNAQLDRGTAELAAEFVKRFGPFTRGEGDTIVNKIKAHVAPHQFTDPHCRF